MAKEFKSFVFPETTKKQIDSLPVEIQLKFYKVVSDYGMYGIEPEGLNALENTIWIGMRDLIDNCKKSNGGAPVGNTNAKKQPVQEKNNQNNLNNVVFDETTETTFNNDNLNLNENVKENDNGNGKEEQVVFISPQSEVYANEVFNVLVDNDLPCCNKNIISFMQRDFRNAMETIHRTMQGIHSDEIIQAVKNYALVVTDPRTWHGWKAKKTFDRFVSWERFKDFLPGNFVLENFLEHSAPKQSNGIGKEDAFRIMEEMGVK